MRHRPRRRVRGEVDGDVVHIDVDSRVDALYGKSGPAHFHIGMASEDTVAGGERPAPEAADPPKEAAAGDAGTCS